jgi:hypothetical protein
LPAQLGKLISIIEAPTKLSIIGANRMTDDKKRQPNALLAL